MILKKLEIRNYRSIKEQTEKDAIIFNGVDCLVGKNNAGKSNIIKAILYLFGKEKDELELFWKRNPELDIDIRGYFDIEDSDFELLEIESKRDSIRKNILDDGTLGICRRSSQGDLEVIGFYPKDKRLRKNNFLKIHSETWDNKQDKPDFERKMREKFPELEDYLTEGKESNKSEWTNAYELFIEDRPEDIVEFIRLPAPPATGISADLKNMLPRVISVPAVKEVTDATKTTKSAELGSLLNELSGEVKEELDEANEQALEEVYKRLNIVEDEDTGEISDERISGVKAIESQLSTYVSETFTDISISLEFPPPESQVMFDNAKVWIDEERFDKVLVDNVGEGVKRILIFSLFRTLADLRSGRLSFSENGEEPEDDEETQETKSHRSLLILYEEAELFLHPGLQKILLRTFRTLFDSDAQIIFSTHSPFMIQQSLLETIGLVVKSPADGTSVTEFHSVLDSREPRDQNTLTQIQNISSYIFADKVLLVEGESDRIVMKKIAKRLNDEWDFEDKGIPILPVHGKGRLPLFHNFMIALGIKPYILLDIDCIERVVNSLFDDDEIHHAQNGLMQQCHTLAEQGEFDFKINKDYINDIIDSYTWNEVLEELKDLFTSLSEEEEPEDEQLGALQRLIEKPEKDAWKRALSSEHEDIIPLRSSITELLLERNTLLLNGTIEKYYPKEAGNKISSAIEFNPNDYSVDQITNYFTALPNKDEMDMELFLQIIFA